MNEKNSSLIRKVAFTIKATGKGVHLFRLVNNNLLLRYLSIVTQLRRVAFSEVLLIILFCKILFGKYAGVRQITIFCCGLRYTLKRIVTNCSKLAWCCLLRHFVSLVGTSSRYSNVAVVSPSRKKTPKF